MSKRIKDLITAELESKFKGSDSVVVVDYIGINATEANKLRSNLRKKKVKITVVRNALAGKALDTLGVKGSASLLTGTNALVYGGDSVVDVVKELLEQAKTIEKLKIKGALVEGRVLNNKDAEALSKLPNRKELQMQIVGQAVSPGRKIAGQLVGPGRKIAGIVKSIIEKKEKEGAAAPVAT